MNGFRQVGLMKEMLFVTGVCKIGNAARRAQLVDAAGLNSIDIEIDGQNQ